MKDPQVAERARKTAGNEMEVYEDNAQGIQSQSSKPLSTLLAVIAVIKWRVFTSQIRKDKRRAACLYWWSKPFKKLWRKMENLWKRLQQSRWAASRKSHIQSEKIRFRDQKENPACWRPCWQHQSCWKVKIFCLERKKTQYPRRIKKKRRRQRACLLRLSETMFKMYYRVAIGKKMDGLSNMPSFKEMNIKHSPNLKVLRTMPDPFPKASD